MTTETTDTTPELDELLDAEPEAGEGPSPDAGAAAEAAEDEELAVPAGSLAAQQIDHSLGTHRGHPVLPFDFRRPYNISKTFEKNMLTICESFAKSASLGFTSMMRANVSVEHESLQLTTFGDFLDSMPQLTFAASIGLPPLAGYSLALLDVGTTVALMKRLMGGLFEEQAEHRKFTDIEFAVSRILMTKIIEAFRIGAEKTVPVEPEILALENNPSYLGTMSNAETVILLRFKVCVDVLEGEIVLCMPLTAFEPVWDLFSPEEGAEFRNQDEVRRDRRQVFDMLQVTGADLVVNLGELRLPMAQVLQFKEGDVIPLHKPVSGKLEVRVRDKAMFLGVPGKVHNSRAVRITDRIETEE